MNDKIDVIGIGAINYDFIFSSEKSDDKKRSKNIDDGEETFVSYKAFEENFKQLQKSGELTHTQIGGSALLSIRTIKEISPELKTAYVGVYGKPPLQAKEFGLPTNKNTLMEKLSTIDDKDWIFEDKRRYSGCALINLYKHQRKYIRICTGVNSSLLKMIKSKGKNEFVSFLASARWIHITSLQNIKDFETIVGYVKEAKRINHHLKVSIDPGYDYMKNRWQDVKKIISVADFVFLSKTEFNCISNNSGDTLRKKALNIGGELLQSEAHPQVLLIKGKSKNVLLSLIDARLFMRTFHHRKLSFTKILNDTGAGDVFAGGFIAGMLSPIMLSHQPAPIELAALVANERLKSIEWPDTLHSTAHDYFCKNMKDERLNEKQKLKIRFEFIKNPLIDFIIGIVVGICSSVLWEVISPLFIHL